MNTRQTYLQYAITAIVALVLWRDLGPLAGIGGFVVANIICNYVADRYQAADNRRYEQRWRNRNNPSNPWN